MNSTGPTAMDAIQGTVCHGQITLAAPVEWPDGTVVSVKPVVPTLDNVEDQPEDPESIARWVAEFNAIPPWEMTAEEEAQWAAARNAQRELDKVRFMPLEPSGE
jgi:hypothetical protein